MRPFFLQSRKNTRVPRHNCSMSSLNYKKYTFVQYTQSVHYTVSMNDIKKRFLLSVPNSAESVLYVRTMLANQANFLKNLDTGGCAPEISEDHYRFDLEPAFGSYTNTIDRIHDVIILLLHSWRTSQMTAGQLLANAIGTAHCLHLPPPPHHQNLPASQAEDGRGPPSSFTGSWAERGVRSLEPFEAVHLMKVR